MLRGGLWSICTTWWTKEEEGETFKGAEEEQEQERAGGRRQRTHRSRICRPSTVCQTRSQLSGSVQTALSRFHRRTEGNHTVCRQEVYSFCHHEIIHFFQRLVILFVD